MSVWGRRGSFTAVAAVLTTWFVLGALSHWARPYLPEVATIQPAVKRGAFVRSGVRHLVAWRDFGTETIQLARRLDRPLLIVEGTAWNPMNYRFDNLFTNPDVAEMVNQEFMPVRIDQSLEPLWRSGILQVTRAVRGDDFTYGVFILSPEGRILAALPHSFMASADDKTAITVFKKVLDDFGNGAVSQDDRLATEEQANLTGRMVSGMPDLPRYFAALEVELMASRGRINHTRIMRLSPHELGFLLDIGATETVQHAVEGIVAEGHLDILRGGYIDFLSQDRQTEYVESTNVNSAMLRTLAKLATVTGSTAHLRLAELQSDFLDTFVEEPTSGLMLAVRADDRGRAPNISVTQEVLNQRLSPEERAVAVARFGLSPRTNPKMLPRLATVQAIVVRQAELESIRKKLALAMPVERPNSQYENLNARAKLIASLLYSDRVLGKPASLKRHVAQAESLVSVMLVGIDEVLSAKHFDEVISGQLPGYIAYTELVWQLYLATEDPQWLERAVSALTRAINLFQLPDGSLAPATMDEVPESWRARFGPEVIDSDVTGSQSAAALLAATIGRIPGQGTQAHQLRVWARSVVEKSSWVVDRLDHGAATLLLACRVEFETPTVAYVGTAAWPIWTKRWPALVIVPAGQGLTGRPPGFYSAGPTGWTGPLSEAELDRIDTTARPPKAR